MPKLILKAVASAKSAASTAVDQVVGQIDSSSGAQRLSVPAQANTQYRLVDSKTGQVIKNQTVVRKGKTLQIEVEGENLVELENFFPEDASQAAPGSEGATYVVDKAIDHCAAGHAPREVFWLVWSEWFGLGHLAKMVSKSTLASSHHDPNRPSHCF